MANNLFVSYGLTSPGQNYEAVIAAIKALGSWAKVHDSLFYVRTSLTYEEAEKAIRPSMEANDKLIVIEASNAHWFNLGEEVSSYIQHNWSFRDLGASQLNPLSWKQIWF